MEFLILLAVPLVAVTAPGLVGVETRYVLQTEGSGIFSFVPGIAAVCVAVMSVRCPWMLGIYRTGGAERNQVPGSLKEVLVLTWCGLRGLAGLALALALPITADPGDPLPGRGQRGCAASSYLLHFEPEHGPASRARADR